MRALHDITGIMNKSLNRRKFCSRIFTVIYEGNHNFNPLIMYYAKNGMQIL